MLLHLLDKEGHFELIDEDFIHLYNLDESALIKLTAKQLAQYQALNAENVIFTNGQFSGRPRRPSPEYEWNEKSGKWEISKEKLTALLEEQRDALIEQIDSHAAGIYSQWTRFESEYRERQAAAENYKSAGYQGECSRYITDFAKRAGIDNKTATNLILVQAAGLEKLQVELANQRMRKYELRAPTLTLEQMQEIYDDIIKQMDVLMEAYKNG